MLSWKQSSTLYLRCNFLHHFHSTRHTVGSISEAIMKHFLTAFSWVRKFKFTAICWESSAEAQSMQRCQYFDREGKWNKEQGNSSGLVSSLQGRLKVSSYSVPVPVLIRWCNNLIQLIKNIKVQQKMFANPTVNNLITSVNHRASPFTVSKLLLGLHCTWIHATRREENRVFSNQKRTCSWK